MKRRSPKVISIIALVFAPLGMLVSLAMYSSDAPWNEMPLLAAALAVGALELAAAIATLSRSRRGPQLFLVYGALALVLVAADLVYLFGMPDVPYTRPDGVVVGAVMTTAFSALGFIFHLIFAIGSLAWPIVAMAIAGGRGRRDEAMPPFLLPQMR